MDPKILQKGTLNFRQPLFQDQLLESVQEFLTTGPKEAGFRGQFSDRYVQGNYRRGVTR